MTSDHRTSRSSELEPGGGVDYSLVPIEELPDSELFPEDVASDAGAEQRSHLRDVSRSASPRGPHPALPRRDVTTYTRPGASSLLPVIRLSRQQMAYATQCASDINDLNRHASSNRIPDRSQLALNIDNIAGKMAFATWLGFIPERHILVRKKAEQVPTYVWPAGKVYVCTNSTQAGEMRMPRDRGPWLKTEDKRAEPQDSYSGHKLTNRERLFGADFAVVVRPLFDHENQFEIGGYLTREAWLAHKTLKTKKVRWPMWRVDNALLRPPLELALFLAGEVRYA